MRISGINIQNFVGSLPTATIEVDNLDVADITIMHDAYRCDWSCRLIPSSSRSPHPSSDRCIDQSELKIERVIFNDPATIVFWSDKTKTVVKCDNKDRFSEEMGLAMACTKKLLGNNYTYYGKFDKALDKATRTLN